MNKLRKLIEVLLRKLKFEDNENFWAEGREKFFLFWQLAAICVPWISVKIEKKVLAISWKEKLLDRMMNVCSSMTKFSHSIQFYQSVFASLFAYLLDFDDEK